MKKREPLPQHVDNAKDVREGVTSLTARLERIRRVLGSPAARRLLDHTQRGAPRSPPMALPQKQREDSSMTDLRAVPEEREPLPQHVDNPLDVRSATQALGARYDRIRRVLAANSALPEARRRAKDELVALSRECLALWSLV